MPRGVAVTNKQTSAPSKRQLNKQKCESPDSEGIRQLGSQIAIPYMLRRWLLSTSVRVYLCLSWDNNGQKDVPDPIFRCLCFLSGNFHWPETEIKCISWFQRARIAYFLSHFKQTSTLKAESWYLGQETSFACGHQQTKMLSRSINMAMTHK